MKRYLDINRLKPAFVEGFKVGDKIVIQEKIDGANFSLKYDSETDTIKSFSRNRELDFQNNLRGAWNFSQTLDKELVKEVLGDRYILFGEHLVPHTVKYPEDKYNKQYFYDVYDILANEYMPYEFASECVNRLNLTFVPTFYVGDFVSWEHIENYVGKTFLGGEYGEGVVVKNQTNLNNPNTKLPFYVKIVSDAFCETKPRRSRNTAYINELIVEHKIQEKVETIVTEARIRKLIHKMIDDNVITENWDKTSMGVIAKNIGRNVYYDCLKEEPETVNEIGEMFGKFAYKVAMKHIRNILNKKMDRN